MLLHELGDDAIEGLLRVDGVAGTCIGGVQHAVNDGEG